MFDFIIEEELNNLKKIVENKKYSDTACINFLSNSELKCDFSENEIYEIHKEFIKLAKDYLIKNHKGKFIIYSDWCVHICTVSFLEKSLKGYICECEYEQC